jgi:hypothetical protein
MKNLSYLLLALSLAAFWSCSSAQDEITSLLPPSTIGYIQLNSPEGLLADAETMMTDLGLAGILQGESIQDLAEGFLQSEGAPFSIADLNLTKPIGMAAIGPATVGDEPILRTFIPSSNPQKLLEAYNSEVPSSRGMKANILGSYLVIDTPGTPAVSGSFDPSKIATSSDGTFSYHLDFAELKSAMGPAFDQVFQSFDEAEELFSSEATTEAELAQFQSIMGTVRQTINDFAGVGGTFTINTEVLGSSLTAAFVPGSQSYESLSSLSSEKDAKDLLKYLSKDAVFNMAFSMDNAALQSLAEDFSNLADIFSSPELMAEYEALMDLAARAIGEDSVASFDMRLTEYVLAYFNAPDLSPIGLQRLFQELDLELYTVSTIKDEGAYIEYLEKYYQENFFSKIVNEVLTNVLSSELDLPAVTISIETKDDPLSLPFYNKEFKINIAIEDNEEFEDTEMLNNLLKGIFQELPFRVAVKDGLAMLTIGENNRIPEILMDGGPAEGSVV